MNQNNQFTAYSTLQEIYNDASVLIPNLRNDIALRDPRSFLQSRGNPRIQCPLENMEDDEDEEREECPLCYAELNSEDDPNLRS